MVRSLMLGFDLKGISRLLLPLLINGFRQENDRVLAALKRYAEALHSGQTQYN
ncbi:MAG TPA: hypothetical protein VMU80_17590 [Bryobacteraceae bacterium]|nr:hypothetical protein [Bryobacteraceae bacterium]